MFLCWVERKCTNDTVNKWSVNCNFTLATNSVILLNRMNAKHFTQFEATTEWYNNDTRSHTNIYTLTLHRCTVLKAQEWHTVHKLVYLPANSVQVITTKYEECTVCTCASVNFTRKNGISCRLLKACPNSQTDFQNFICFVSCNININYSNALYSFNVTKTF